MQTHIVFDFGETSGLELMGTAAGSYYSYTSALSPSLGRQRRTTGAPGASAPPDLERPSLLSCATCGSGIMKRYQASLLQACLGKTGLQSSHCGLLSLADTPLSLSSHFFFTAPM